MSSPVHDDRDSMLAQDMHARELIRSALDQTLIVEAAAGTGKTTELVERITSVLRTGLAKVEHVVAVTFTHKAAGELKIRLRQKLDEERQSARGQELAYLEDALKRLEEAAIGTIHSFCTQILRERPVEAGVDPNFEDVPEQEQRRLYKRTFQNWFERALEQSRPGVRRVLTRMAWNSSDSPVDELEAAGWKLIEWRDFDSPWRCQAFDRVAAADVLSESVRQLSALSKRCQKASDELYRSLAPVRELDSWLERTDGRPDDETLEARLIKLLKDLNRDKKKGRGVFADGVRREDVHVLRDSLIDKLAAFREQADADLASVLREEMRDLIDGYEQMKHTAGKLDFADLLLRTRNLIRDNMEVRTFLRNRFARIFVDEFQDTEPLQAEILLLLAGGDRGENDWRAIKPIPGKLFIVGDPKQSIYRFRGADVVVYQDVRDKLVAAGARIVYLAKSFRATQPIQDCINAAFAREMQENRVTAQASYVPLLGGAPPIQDQQSIIALPAPISWTGQQTTKKEINQCLPDGICAFIEWLLRESGWRVRDPDGESGAVPIRPRHIAVLFKRVLNNREDMARPYIRSLEARDIPHLLVASRSFHQREEVETLRAACGAIEWPDDELAVYAALRGPLFSIPDNLLLRYRLELKVRLHPLRSRGEEALPDGFEPIIGALDVLADLHRNRNRRPIAGTVQRLLEATRAYMGFALRPGGHQVLANVYRVIELARSFEQTGGISFRAFVEELTARAESYESAEAPMIEESADGVRLLTVHNAKGLEFPIVILADMTANIAVQEPDRYVDTAKRLCATRLVEYAPFEYLRPRDLVDHANEENARDVSEGVRVAYVAATRARDLLVVPVVGIDRMWGWLGPLNKAVYPKREEYRTRRTARGCPTFGTSTVLTGPEDQTICPGIHQSEVGSHQVAWWDPCSLRLDVDAKQGLRTIELLKGEPGPSTLAYKSWCEQREHLIALGVQPTREIVSPSEIGEAPEIEITVQRALISRVSEGPRGLRFGTLVHRALRDSIRNTETVGQIIHGYGCILGATDEEMDAAQQVVENALGHSLLRRARSSPRCHAELPLFLRLDDSRTLEGICDLAFLEGETWNVVDFKTDEDSSSGNGQYERQIQWYGYAISQLTALPALCHLLFV